MFEPLVVIPVLRPEEPWEDAVYSAMTAGCRVLVIDNSEGQIDWPQDNHLWVTQPYQNLGCAGSWNFGIRSSVTEPYWLVMNADTVVTAEAIEYLTDAMEQAGDRPAWVGVDGDWRVFAINPAFIEEVGWFDERFHPIYLEDCDMEWRAKQAGAICDKARVTGSTHGGGKSWQGQRAREVQNEQTWRSNAEAYKQKWGGGHRGNEAYSTPFNSGQPDRCGPSILRLRSQTWTL